MVEKSKRQRTKFNENLEKEYEYNFNRWREFDLLTCLIAVVGLALAMVEYEYGRKLSNQITTHQEGLSCGDSESYQECARFSAHVR